MCTVNDTYNERRTKISSMIEWWIILFIAPKQVIVYDERIKPARSYINISCYYTENTLRADPL